VLSSGLARPPTSYEVEAAKVVGHRAMPGDDTIGRPGPGDDAMGEPRPDDDAMGIAAVAP
jgi:hypothetical protein